MVRVDRAKAASVPFQIVFGSQNSRQDVVDLVVVMERFASTDRSDSSGNFMIVCGTR